MRIPIDWLNEYVPNDLPLRQLADTLTNMGLEVEEIRSAGGAAVFDIKVLSSRGDCLSVEGIARELATALHREFALRQPVVTESGPPAQGAARVVLEDPLGCPRYSARIVRGVKIGPSPEWAQRRLELCGLRPISNVVDATNLAMLEVGQPLHAFDYKLLHGEPPTIIVRRARPGEKLLLIDGSERELSPELLLITDPSGPIAIAGIMGGATSEINDATTEVLLESAHFDPRAIRRGARFLQMSTEASYRFERTVDPGGTVRALDRVCELIAEFSATPIAIAQGVIDSYPRPFQERVIRLRPPRANALLGTDLSPEEMAEHLGRLQLKVSGKRTLVVQVPTFRQDLQEEIDLIEEVARAYGYQHIPETLPAQVGVGRQAPALVFDAEVRQVLRGLGLSEVVTYSLESPEHLERLGLPEGHPLAAPVRLSNPKSREHSQLRTTLLTSLLDVVSLNRRYGLEDIAVFDLGTVYLPAGENALPEQPQHLGLAGAGEVLHGFFNLPKEATRWDFCALKNAVEQVLRGVARLEAEYAPDANPLFSPTQCARLHVDGEAIGYLGQVRDAILEAWDLPDPVSVAELDLSRIRELARPQAGFQPLSRFQAAVRDVAFVLPRAVAATRAEEVIRGSAGQHLETLRLFDVYEGKPLPEGHRNLAFSLTFRRPDRTLTDEELDTVMSQVRTALRDQLNAAIRE